MTIPVHIKLFIAAQFWPFSHLVINDKTVKNNTHVFLFRPGPGLFFSDMEYQFVSLFLNVPVRHVIADVATDIQKQVCLLLHWSDNRSLLPMHCTLFYKHICICHYIDLLINIITYSFPGRNTQHTWQGKAWLTITNDR